MNKEKILKNIPYFMMRILVNLKGKQESKNRFNGSFQKYLKQFTQSDNQNRRNLDFDRVKEAIKNVPYYQNDYLNVNKIEDLPIISKKDILKDKNLFINKEIEIQQDLNTSGSTGTAFIFPITEDFFNKKFAAVWYFRNSHKLFKEKKNANLIGRVFLSTKKNKPPYWVDVKTTNQLLLSQYHLSEKTVREYLKAIIKHKVKWLHGYPSSLALLASYSKEHTDLTKNIELEAITCSSESLSSSQRLLIESVFSTKLLDFYGQAEGVADIYQCEEGNLHVNEDYSYVEFIKDESTSYYRIVGTQLSNKVLPFVRYDTGDLAELPSENFKCDCGRNSRVVKRIIGRVEDNIYLSDGRQIGRLDHIFKATFGVLEAQIHQYNKGSAEFWIVKKENYTEKDEKSLNREIKNKLGEDFNYTIVYKESIPRTKAGKLKAVVSHIKK
ncbi:phenylacetate--CoA ligase [Flavobacteriaceae bacterium UJ101]|nr:phenylacetate--CoA ligase [Flavobacteriaceae bacterium UJ101]